jgi:chromosome segregation ATPase
VTVTNKVSPKISHSSVFVQCDVKTVSVATSTVQASISNVSVATNTTDQYSDQQDEIRRLKIEKQSALNSVEEYKLKLQKTSENVAELNICVKLAMKQQNDNFRQETSKLQDRIDQCQQEKSNLQSVIDQIQKENYDLQKRVNRQSCKCHNNDRHNDHYHGNRCDDRYYGNRHSNNYYRR